MCSHHVGQTTAPGSLPTASRDSIGIVTGLCHCFPECSNFPSTAVIAAKLYVQHSNLGRLLTFLSQNVDVLGTFCRREYGHLDVI